MHVRYWQFFCILAVCILGLSGGKALAGSLQNLGNGICLDKATGLMWQIDKGKRFSDAGEAEKYVAAARLGGYDDWRLPTTRESCELRGLIAIQGNDDCKFFKLKSKYWLIDEKKGLVPARLELECFCRGDYDLVVKDKGYIRLVRSTKEKK